MTEKKDEIICIEKEMLSTVLEDGRHLGKSSAFCALPVDIHAENGLIGP